MISGSVRSVPRRHSGNGSTTIPARWSEFQRRNHAELTEPTALLETITQQAKTLSRFSIPPRTDSVTSRRALELSTQTTASSHAHHKIDRISADRREQKQAKVGRMRRAVPPFKSVCIAMNPYPEACLSKRHRLTYLNEQHWLDDPHRDRWSGVVDGDSPPVSPLEGRQISRQTVGGRY